MRFFNVICVLVQAVTLLWVYRKRVQMGCPGHSARGTMASIEDATNN
jgi:hypothetical protein